jgi:hypothetical protein
MSIWFGEKDAEVVLPFHKNHSRSGHRRGATLERVSIYNCIVIRLENSGVSLPGGRLGGGNRGEMPSRTNNFFTRRSVPDACECVQAVLFDSI